MIEIIIGIALIAVVVLAVLVPANGKRGYFNSHEKQQFRLKQDLREEHEREKSAHRYHY